MGSIFGRLLPRMKHACHALLILLVFATGRSAVAQDRILMMNGEIHEGRVLGQSTLEVRYLQQRKNGLLKNVPSPPKKCSP